MFDVQVVEKSNKVRELAEWFKAVSLKLIWLIKSHPFKSDILCISKCIHGSEPGWLGASFGLRISYVRIIMTRIYNICNFLY